VIKIAIFHNLKSGGGLIQLQKIVQKLIDKNYIIDIYSHQNYSIPGIHKKYIFPISKTNNSINQSIQTVFELNRIQKYIAKKIKNRNYKYIFIFPCHIVQSPHILRFLPKENTYYFFLEPKREFYEKTSFDYYSPKRILSRLIRYPIKFYDQINCKSITHIIANSIFSQHNLKKIYNKNSTVIYPGLKFIKPKKIVINNNHRFLSLGLLTMLKGHHISANLVSKLHIYGNISHENIFKYLPKNIHINTNLIDRYKLSIYKKHTFFLANQINESFGLTTLEATNNNCYVLGKNIGGTPEIIINGYNGTLLLNNFFNSKKTINEFNNKKTITFYKTCIINWSYTVEQILKLIHVK
jgi:glycosyltransferase involved in cell wall biosynthesis